MLGDYKPPDKNNNRGGRDDRESDSHRYENRRRDNSRERRDFEDRSRRGEYNDRNPSRNYQREDHNGRESYNRNNNSYNRDDDRRYSNNTRRNDESERRNDNGPNRNSGGGAEVDSWRPNDRFGHYSPTQPTTNASAAQKRKSRWSDSDPFDEMNGNHSKTAESSRHSDDANRRDPFSNSSHSNNNNNNNTNTNNNNNNNNNSNKNTTSNNQPFPSHSSSGQQHYDNRVPDLPPISQPPLQQLPPQQQLTPRQQDPRNPRLLSLPPQTSYPLIVAPPFLHQHPPSLYMAPAPPQEVTMEIDQQENIGPTSATADNDDNDNFINARLSRLTGTPFLPTPTVQTPQVTNVPSVAEPKLADPLPESTYVAPDQQSAPLEQTKSPPVWEGELTKNGVLVCRMTGHRLSKTIPDNILPPTLDMKLRAPLDSLKPLLKKKTKYLLYFRPINDSAEVAYRDFIKYLADLKRAAVIKMEAQGRTLYLIPPSDFSKNVLNIKRGKFLYGVITESSSSAASDSPEAAG
eukprot:CAMPEP_0184335814 /NCGR_PEP_ID=MMETSP1089-20130417/4312_1 /TAXON_ID=38269 ORGANISM="Gloeochaete wittrockiana, Strain SAG46.84" /NCGR_SAMPLE_ID=MMETSP1089 /ASSEMBLY_ACC=CAM_ASM_000445 /LENGTH=517 /DNA_ID=CAMNT_0026660657 /DNA_START=115 /DNA_END=1664 /DNA_ORIENTATION=+